mgnify:CR=1 FL=1
MFESLLQLIHNPGIWNKALKSQIQETRNQGSKDEFSQLPQSKAKAQRLSEYKSKRPLTDRAMLFQSANIPDKSRTICSSNWTQCDPEHNEDLDKLTFPLIVQQQK